MRQHQQQQMGSGVVGDPVATKLGRGELVDMGWALTSPLRRLGRKGAVLFGGAAVVSLVLGYPWLAAAFVVLCVLAAYGQSEGRVGPAPLSYEQLESAMHAEPMPYYMCTTCRVLMDEIDVFGGMCAHCTSAATCLHITAEEDIPLALAAAGAP